MNRTADRISGTFWLCFSVLIIVQSYRLGLGTLHKPGPGFLFFWVNILLALMSLVVLIRTWIGKGAEGAQSALFQGQNIPKIIFVLLSLFLYVILMETLGFILVTFFLFMFLLGIIEKKKWLLTVFMSGLVTVISYVIFEVWLKSMLPEGLLGFLRF